MIQGGERAGEVVPALEDLEFEVFHHSRKGLSQEMRGPRGELLGSVTKQGADESVELQSAALMLAWGRQVSVLIQPPHWRGDISEVL